MLTAGRKYYQQQQRLSALAARQVTRDQERGRSMRLLMVYQATAATLAAEAGTDALAEQAVESTGAALVPSAFTVTPDAPSVLDDVSTPMQFARIVASLVADSGRSAMGAFTATRSVQVGNIRQLVPPSCSRCAILAGRWYRWSDGFQRHPLCDCVMVPGTPSVASWDPYGAYERGEITDLSAAQRAAIEDGADIAQVVNASRGLQTINFAGRRVQVTTEGTTSRGIAFSSLSQRGGTRREAAGFATRITRTGPETRAITRTVARAPRLSPEAIYRVADGDRAVAQRLLRINGYVT